MDAGQIEKVTLDEIIPAVEMIKKEGLLND
jgi:hypothetical protein